jgi:hypothetical protein
MMPGADPAAVDYLEAELRIKQANETKTIDEAEKKEALFSWASPAAPKYGGGSGPAKKDEDYSQDVTLSDGTVWSLPTVQEGREARDTKTKYHEAIGGLQEILNLSAEAQDPNTTENRRLEIWNKIRVLAPHVAKKVSRVGSAEALSENDLKTAMETLPNPATRSDKWGLVWNDKLSILQGALSAVLSMRSSWESGVKSVSIPKE